MIVRESCKTQLTLDSSNRLCFLPNTDLRRLDASDRRWRPLEWELSPTTLLAVVFGFVSESFVMSVISPWPALASVESHLSKTLRCSRAFPARPNGLSIRGAVENTLKY